MASLLPTCKSVEHSVPTRTEIVVDGTGSGAVLSAIASETAQQILRALRDGPKPVSTIADDAGTSIQNAVNANTAKTPARKYNLRCNPLLLSNPVRGTSVG